MFRAEEILAKIQDWEVDSDVRTTCRGGNNNGINSRYHIIIVLDHNVLFIQLPVDIVATNSIYVKQNYYQLGDLMQDICSI